MNPEPLIQIHNLSTQRGGKNVLKVDNLAIYPDETLAVIGPNGAGKSTLLLNLAHLLKTSHGQILFRGQPIEAMNDLSYRRKIALVLQEPLLLDGTVFNNIAAPLRYRRMPRSEVTERVNTWLERLGIEQLRHRSAKQLSGGEAQRTSLARALAIQPDLLLLDEPFSALDAPTRQHLLHDLRTLLIDTRVATVFITHDQDEALSIGDRVAVILGGSLRQVGTPSQVFSTPNDEEIASFVGVETVLPGKVSNADLDQVTILVNGLQIHAVGKVKPGQQVMVCLRPEDITLWRNGELPSSSARNRLQGKIMHLAPLGSLVRVEVVCDEIFPAATSPTTMVALVTRHSAEEMALAPGVEVTVTFKASAVHLIAR